MVLWKFSDLVTATPSILSLLGSSLAGCHDGNLIKQLSSSQYQCVFSRYGLSMLVAATVLSRQKSVVSYRRVSGLSLG
jgi:hypothetical protein